MTVLQYVSQGQMEDQTGFRTALGYAFPKEDKILIREGLPKELEKEVKQHEEDHILKGEEGPGLFSSIGKIFGGKSKKKGAKRARIAGEKASDRQFDIYEESQRLSRQDIAPYQKAGGVALNAMMSMTGLGGTPYNPGADEAANQAVKTKVNIQDYLGAFRKQLGGKGKRRMDQWAKLNPYDGEQDPQEYLSGYAAILDSKRQRRFNVFQSDNPIGAVYGGPIGRRYGGQVGPRTGGVLERDPSIRPGGPQQYNINETGPEDNFSGGGVTRNPDPQTIAPSQEGYIAPNENPGGVEGGYNFMTDPGYEFRIGEGGRALERGAAASGGLLSGGFARKMTRYAQDYASNEYTNVYNRIAGIAGMGANASNQAGGRAMQGGEGMSNAAGNRGYYSASGYVAQGNAQADISGNSGRMADTYNPFG